MKKEQSFFGKQLRKIMAEKGITQKELAEKLGVFQTMISHWLTGIKNPTISSVKKLADALEVSVSYFIDENITNETAKKENKSDSLVLELVLEKIKHLETEIELLKAKIDKK